MAFTVRQWYTFYETHDVKSTGFRKRWQKPQIQESQVVNVFILACFWDYRGHFVRYCEINPDRDSGHQNTPRTILQTDVLTGKWKTFTFRKHFVFKILFIWKIYKATHSWEKISQSPQSEPEIWERVSTVQISQSGIRLQLQDGNRWLKFLLRGYKDQSLSQLQCVKQLLTAAVFTLCRSINFVAMH